MKLNSIEPSVEVEAAEEPIKYILELISSSPSEEEVASQLSDTSLSAAIELLISDFVDDPDMLKIIEMVVDGLSERIKSVLTTFGDSNFTMVSEIAQQLKGASGGYEYPLMSKLAFHVGQLEKCNAEVDQIEAALTVLVDECHRTTVGVRGSIASGPVVDSTRSDVAVDSESAFVSDGFVQNEEQSATLATIHEQVSKAVQSAENQAAVGNPLCKIAAEIDSLDDPDVDSQQLSAALMSLTSVLGKTTTTNTQVADTVG